MKLSPEEVTQIGKTILSQMGGNRFIAMTGATKLSIEY